MPSPCEDKCRSDQLERDGNLLIALNEHWITQAEYDAAIAASLTLYNTCMTACANSSGGGGV